MITEDGDVLFPMNAVQLMYARFKLIDPDILVVRRRLYSTDAAQSIGVSAAMWSPDRQSYEMRGTLAQEPTVQHYQITVQCLIKHASEESGMALHAKLSQMVRRIILADAPLALSLRALSSTLYGVRERTLRWTVPSQRYLANEEPQGQFIYLSSIEVQLETENTGGG